MVVSELLGGGKLAFTAIDRASNSLDMMYLVCQATIKTNT